MEAVFLKLLRMSFIAAMMILAVLPARLLLKKAPRWSICLLWALVALRLVCPFSFESHLSLVPGSVPVSQETFEVQTQPLPEINPSVQVQVPEVSQPVETPEVTRTPSLLSVLAGLWLTGALGMVAYAAVSYFRLRRKVATATRLEGNVYQSEFVDAPFVLGVLRPRIYLPYGLTQPHLDHILAHERSHIRRGDHLYKPFGFLVLSLHWFNPLVWVAYLLLCRDIEAACDEKVIRDMDHTQRQSYSATLLRCSVHRRAIAACPLAFGQTGVKQRIKAVLDYKKPTLWVILAVLLVGIVSGVCFLTERPEPSASEPQPTVSVQDEMDALLDILLDQEDPYILSEPYKCTLLNTEAYEKLLSYDEQALSYFVPKLRKADIHSYREYMVAWVCGKLTGIDFGGQDTWQQWWKVPQMWVAEYDRVMTAQTVSNRLSPGVYTFVGFALPSDDSYSMSAWLQESNATYLVTVDSLVRVYSRNGTTIDPTHSFSDTVWKKLDWKWQSADATEELQKIDRNLGRVLEKLKEEKPALAQEPLLEEERLYQPLDERNCLVYCGDRVYLVCSKSGVAPFSQLAYITEMTKMDYSHTA